MIVKKKKYLWKNISEIKTCLLNSQAIVALFACVALALAAEPAKKDAAASSDLQTANSFYGGYGLGYGLGYGGEYNFGNF